MCSLLPQVCVAAFVDESRSFIRIDRQIACACRFSNVSAVWNKWGAGETQTKHGSVWPLLERLPQQQRGLYWRGKGEWVCGTVWKMYLQRLCLREIVMCRIGASAG